MTNMNGIEQLIFIGVKGRAMAVFRRTGQIVWETHLKSSGFVNLVRDGEDLLATTAGEIFCLDPGTGRIRWSNPLRGMGFGLVTIASANPLPAMMEELNRESSDSNDSPFPPQAAPPTI